jgi:phage major head subunit gpT-like protein
MMTIKLPVAAVLRRADTGGMVAAYIEDADGNRQAIINDDLRAFERLVTAFGFAARRLENRTVYSQLTANAALADGTALFHANHSNLITSSALAIATLGAGRTAMRLQKGLQSEELNLAPAFLIVPATLEQTAYKL